MLANRYIQYIKKINIFLRQKRLGNHPKKLACETFYTRTDVESIDVDRLRRKMFKEPRGKTSRLIVPTNRKKKKRQKN